MQLFPPTFSKGKKAPLKAAHVEEHPSFPRSFACKIRILGNGIPNLQDPKARMSMHLRFLGLEYPPRDAPLVQGALFSPGGGWVGWGAP